MPSSRPEKRMSDHLFKKENTTTFSKKTSGHVFCVPKREVVCWGPRRNTSVRGRGVRCLHRAALACSRRQSTDGETTSVSILDCWGRRIKRRLGIMRRSIVCLDFPQPRDSKVVELNSRPRFSDTHGFLQKRRS
ncbi:unnamed protein product [Ectocarpus sp. 8 AP-2014]